IGRGAFEGCSNLVNITIPDRVTSIGNAAFRGCSNLKTLTIPKHFTIAHAKAMAWFGSERIPYGCKIIHK
ncbi:MAG: leucine-rich repeat protein, partial [Lentisphaeria bacterium]|nr:leucine-rich repeat protein [Lentisphaeria bacterium]